MKEYHPPSLTKLGRIERDPADPRRQKVVCAICSKMVADFRCSEEPEELILYALRSHHRAEHPRAAEAGP